MLVANCTLAPLTPYVASQELPWNEQAVRHIHARLGFGLAPADIAAALDTDPQDYVLGLLRAAANADPMPTPPWHDWARSDYSDNQQFADQIMEFRNAWIQEMRERAVRGKFQLFWSGHFVTSLEKYICPSWMWSYYDNLQTYAFGNFKDFVRAIGITPAMLVYLDGVLSTRFDPNENYARELLELFTLGEGNAYTQTDITEAARALTGYNGFTELCAPITFQPAQHDDGAKTIFGREGNFDYDGLIDVLFDERGDEISLYICERIYRHFVSTQIDGAVVAELAATLRQNNWSLLAVYEQLFSSAHFFSLGLQGALIKGPLDLILTAETTLGTEALYGAEATQAVIFLAGTLGQLLLAPPDVAGWPGDRDWINANSLSVRHQAGESLLFAMFQDDRLSFVSWARTLELPELEDIESVTRAIVDAVLPKGFHTEEDYQQAILVARSEVPSYYFEEGLWSLDFEYAPEQILLLLVHLFRRPEYQTQ